MSFGANLVVFAGYVGRKPDVRHTDNGTKVATLSVGSSRKWKDKDGELQDETTWMRVVVWKQKAEFVENYINIGAPVMVEGRLQTTEWTDDEGVKRYGVEIVAAKIQSPRGGGRKSEGPHPASRESESAPDGGYIPSDPGDDDIPF
jgi:single-strand DNA-binding protein